MPLFTSRRRFLKQAVWAGVGGVGGSCLLPHLSAISAQEARLPADAVQFSPDIEPLVRLIEDTPREQLVEQMAARVHAGLAYRDVLAALLLAGVRNVQPRPHVGFKFHAVLVVNSAHLASLASPDRDRWLPIFWALDYFKSAQLRDHREGDWTLAALPESRLPRGAHAKSQFVEAMDRWDVEAADAAVAGLVRSASTWEIYELLFRYGAGDLRDIGHKAIYAANSFRTLNCIGWQYAEPVLRSLAYALLCHSGEPNPSEADLAPDRPWRESTRIAQAFPSGWSAGRVDAGASEALRGALSSDGYKQVQQLAIEQLSQGVAVQSIWDAIFLGASELLVQQPGIISLHALTSSNALHFAFQTVASDDSRRRILLQNLAFLCHFRDRLPKINDQHTEKLQALVTPMNLAADHSGAEHVFAELHSQPTEGARKAYSYLLCGGSPAALMDEARRMVFLKGTDSHDYKFSSAVLEDFYHVSPALRNQYLAAATYMLHGADEPDNSLVHRIRTAFSRRA